MNASSMKFGIPLLAGGGAMAWFASADHAVAALGVGVAAIFAHWGLSTGDKNEEAADSSYFLGFMLTLVLLSVGLYNLGKKSTGGSTADVLPFLFDLSIGLTLTVVGLAVRQMRVLGAPSRGAAPDEALREEVSRLVAAQHGLTGTVESLGRTFNGSLFGDSVGATDAAFGRAQESASHLAAQIGAATATIEGAVRKLERSMLDAASRIDGATGRANTEIDRGVELLATKLNFVLSTMDEERERITASLRSSSEAAESAHTSIGGQLLSQVQAWKSQLELVRGQLLQLHAQTEEEYGRGLRAVGEATRSFTELSQNVTQQMETLPDPSERLEGLWTGIQRLDDLLAHNAREAAGQLSTLTQGAVTATNAVGALSRATASSATEIGSGGEAAGRAIRKELGEIETILSQFHKVLESRISKVGAR